MAANLGGNFSAAMLAFREKDFRLTSERSMHYKNNNSAEIARVTREYQENLLRGPEAPHAPHHAATHQAVSVNPPNSAAPPVATQPLAPVLAVPQVSPPTTLNLNTHSSPMAIPDNFTLGGGGTKALNGLNGDLYRRAPPPNLDYCNLLPFAITVMEMATYIPLAYLWPGFLTRTSASMFTGVLAKMMLWARGLDNDPDLNKKVGNLRSTLKHKDAEYPIADNSASSWTRTKSILSRSSPNLIADVRLLRIRHGVTRIPQGQHRGRLTVATEHTHLHGHQDVMLSQIEEYIQHFNLTVPVPLTASADEEAVEDFNTMYAAAH